MKWKCYINYSASFHEMEMLHKFSASSNGMEMLHKFCASINEMVMKEGPGYS